MRDTAQVAYTGLGYDGVALGDHGMVLSSDGHVAHVKWATGARAQQVVAVYDHDLSVLSGRAVESSLEDSLEVGSLMAFSSRRAYDEAGETGVLNQMVEHGHLASFGEIAEEALALVAARVRTEPSMRAVLAELDDEEGESVLRLASACLIRDAFGEEV